MSNFVIHNGKLKRNEEITFYLQHKIVKFADGFFETMRSFAINIPLLKLHYKRIKKAFNLLLLNKNNFPDEETLLFDIQRLIKSNKHFGSNKIRLTVYRTGEGSIYPNSDNIDWFIESIPLENKKFTLNKQGLHIDIFDYQPKPIINLYSIKLNNAIFYIMASQWAKANNLNDALLVNNFGNIIESSIANVFIFYKNELITPPLSDGCVDGIMRRYLIENIIPEMNVKFSEKSIKKELLLEADEIFLTNAVKGCQWVVGYKNRRYYNNISRKIIEMLNKKLLQNE